MAVTFAQLGIPFPLFAAPIDETTDYVGAKVCKLCGILQPHTFRVDAVMIPCSSCNSINALETNSRHDAECSQCKSIVPFPNREDDSIQVCYSCLREGKAAIVQDTELGMVHWEHFWLCEITPEARNELLRTPGYLSWQDERWLFCCGQPMVYLGDWGRDEFNAQAPNGDGKLLFDEIVIDREPDMWELDEYGESISYYVFQCSQCQKLSCYWDMT